MLSKLVVSPILSSRILLYSTSSGIIFWLTASIVVTIILSAIISSLKFQTTYSTISATDLSTIQNTVKVENLFNYDGIKYIISNAT